MNNDENDNSKVSEESEFQIVTCSSVIDSTQSNQESEHIPGGSEIQYESNIFIPFPKLNDDWRDEPKLALRQIPQRNANGDIVNDHRPVFGKRTVTVPMIDLNHHD